MVVPELKSLSSPDVERGRLPPNPQDCVLRFVASIGLVGDPRADRFFFSVATTQALYKQGQSTWGRGYLLVPRFSWPEVERLLTELLRRHSVPSWDHLALLLNRELIWEYDFTSVSA